MDHLLPKTKNGALQNYVTHTIPKFIDRVHYIISLNAFVKNVTKKKLRFTDFFYLLPIIFHSDFLAIYLDA